jgi:ribonuclease HI
MGCVRRYNVELEEYPGTCQPRIYGKEPCRMPGSSVACARRSTPTRIIITLPKWESKTYWKKILETPEAQIVETPEAQIVTEIPANCFGFTPENTLRGRTIKAGSCKWPIVVVMISNEKRNSKPVPEEFEEEMNMWLQEHKWKGKKKQFHTQLPKETPRVRRDRNDNRVYTDGSFDPATNKAGYSIYYGPEHPCSRFERVEGEQSIARAELMAIVKLLEEHPAKSELTILTDSQICLKMLKKWTSPYIKGSLKGVPNEDLIKRAVTMLEKRQKKKDYATKSTSPRVNPKQ